MAHWSAASPQIPLSRQPNYKQIELLAVCAAGLDIYEKGGEKKLPILHQMMKERYLKHVDLLASNGAMELYDNTPFPWPQWPEDVSVAIARQRAEKPDSLWRKLHEILREIRKYEAILEAKKQHHGGNWPSGWNNNDVVNFLLTSLWEKEEDERINKSIDLVSESETSAAASCRVMPRDWEGPRYFLAWRKFGQLGDNHIYITSDKGVGPLNRHFNGESWEPDSIILVVSEDKENGFPQNPSPRRKPKGREKMRREEAELSMDDEDSSKIQRIETELSKYNKIQTFRLKQKERHHKLRKAKALFDLEPSQENKSEYYNLLVEADPDVPDFDDSDKENIAL
jgi:hypothetical protein